MKTKILFSLAILFFLPLLTYAQQTATELPTYYIPHRIYDTQNKQWIDLETLLANIAQDEVVFLGEQHNDTYGHRMELAVLQGIARRRSNVVLAMEMFERDVQIALDDYRTNKITETEFLSRSRPWANYMEDYRPLVEFAREKGWRVVASNAPQRLSRTVSTQGLSILEKFSPADRALVAAECDCPHDEYWQRFSQVMTAMGASHGNANANPHGVGANNPAVLERIERLYQAQCVKDETMGESIANIIAGKDGAKPFVVHVNGDFHSAFGEGTAARARRRRVRGCCRCPARAPRRRTSRRTASSRPASARRRSASCAPASPRSRGSRR